MSDKRKARVVYDAVSARYIGEVVLGDEILVAFARHTWDGAMAAAKTWLAQVPA